MLSVKDKEPSSAKKRTIKFKNIDLRQCKFVDDSGDITESVLEAIPEDVTFVDFRITMSLDEE